MNLGRTLAFLFPDANPGTDYTVRLGEDGEPYIAEWNLAVPEPTTAEIETASLEAARELKKASLSDEAREELTAHNVLARTDDADAKRDEFALIAYSQLVALCDHVGFAVDPRLRTLAQTGQKLQAKHAEVEAAADPNTVTWEDPA